MEGKRLESPQPSCVSVKSDRSMGRPYDFRDRERSTDVRSDSPQPSCVSMKSDRSIGRPYDFRDGDRSTDGRSESPQPSCVSMKSDRSMGCPDDFRDRDKSTDVRSESPQPSCVSMKSDRSMGRPYDFRDRDRSTDVRSDSPQPSCVFMKSDRSVGCPDDFRDRDRSTDVRSESPQPSCVSMKSDRSMGRPYEFRDRDRSTDVRSDSPQPSCVSMKSDRSMGRPYDFRDGNRSTDMRSESPQPICVSMKSDRSIGRPYDFRDGDRSTNVSSDSPQPSCVFMKSDQSEDHPIDFRDGDRSTDVRPQKKKPNISRNQLESIFKELEHKVITLIKNEMKRFRKILSPDYPACTEREVEDEEDLHSVREEALKIVLHVLKNMNHTDLAKTLHNKSVASGYQTNLKSNLREKVKRINEGISQHGVSALLNEIYTELYITEGWSGDVNNEHEVRQIETVSRRPKTQETPIKCNDLFKDRSTRSVLTKGVAGIGKTVSVQKFILDWTEGKANKDVTFMFPLPFRELNLMKEKNLSLMNLLHYFFPEIKELKLIACESYKVLLIFDGLDECRLTLNFQNNEILCDVTESASVDVLLTNLIKGNLLPSALLWITSRPAAANQIPPECVDQVTEVRGFSDPQKEEYFRKRISDQSLAKKTITHMKSSRSLYIMCHIPVFCWISATVLERMFGEAESGEIPKTLTQMFTHFLIFQIKHKNQKYHQKCDPDPQQTRETILALGKLAFQQLEKGNLIFYEEDLRECGIDVREVAVYSGVCTQIFREESGLHLGKVFSFIHLSVQEFLAALYTFLRFIFRKTNKLVEQNIGIFNFFRNQKMSDLLRSAVDKALQSENGHLDLFLRFLLGLSLESNQTLLRDLIPQTGSSCHNKQETVEFIKRKIRKTQSPEKSINLFHCLNELNDHSLVQEVQTYLNRGGDRCLSGVSLSPSQWSALVFVLLNSEQELDEFNLRKYRPSDECLLRLLPVVKASRKAVFADCNLTVKSCEILASALQSSVSLIDLDLSQNDLKDSGVKFLSVGLSDPHCKLQTLRLSVCLITHKGCSFLASALKSNPSYLKELDLSYNHPGDSGIRELTERLNDLNCKLETFRFAGCNLTVKSCEIAASALQSSASLIALDLSQNNLEDSGFEFLSVGLSDPRCKLQTLRLVGCNLTVKSCEIVSSALQSSASLIDLDLSQNDLKDSGVEFLSVGLSDPQCKLQTLRLSGCLITHKGCSFLASALKSNPSYLKELDLSYNHPGDSGIRELTDRLNDPNFKLETFRFDHGGECMISPGVRRYVCDLTLDLNTVNRNLSLSEKNRKVRNVNKVQLYPKHPERFEDCPQVLCRESLSGRHYWETKWSGNGGAVAVTYKSIERKGGSDSVFGYNKMSWSLICSGNRYSVRHNNNHTDIPVPSPYSRRVGVYLDCPAGTLSFYSISSDTLTHLYTFHSTFTEPLYLGFRVSYFSSVSLCQIT